MPKDATSRRDSFAAWMEERGLTTYRVAKDTGIPYQTLASFMQGDTRSLKGDTEAKIATHYDLSTDEIFGGAVARTIPIVGYVGASSDFHGFDDYAQGGGLERIDAPADAPPHAVAVIARGDSAYPFIRDGMILIYWDRYEDPRMVMGEPCFVRLTDGRTLLKLIEPGSQPGKWTLNSINSAVPPIRDVEIEWAAPIEHWKRRRNWRAA